MSCLPTEPRPIQQPPNDGPVTANPKKQFPVKPIHTPRTMKSRKQIKTMKSRTPIKTALALAALVGLALAALPAQAGITVDNSKIVSGSAIGTLAAIDVPYSPVRPASGGPDWPESADDGFTTVGSPIRDYDGTSKWEPDGTPIGEAQAYMVYNGGVPSVKWTFNQAAAGIDLPDGTVIWGVYATWNTRGKDGITYQYTEGTQSGSIIRQTGGAGPAADLVLSWTDDVDTTRNGNFERILAGPIVVGGGDGFELWGTDNVGNAAHIDAVVIDYQAPSAVPIIIAKSPADGASGVLLATDIQARFDRNMSLTGTGTVTLRNLTLGSGSDIVINLPDSQVSVSGDTLTINPTANLALGTDYAIQISGDALKDSGDTPFGGILDDTTWNFTTTSDNTPPTIATLYPADNATDVLPFLNLVATFGENVQLTGTGTVTIRNLTLGTDASITLPNSQVSVAGAVLTINPTANLAFSTDYALQISADAVVDSSANAFGGILDNTTWNFTTAGTAGGVAVTPDHIVTGSATGTLRVIDPPKTTGDDGNAAGIGFAGGTGGDHTFYGWEPDGTDDNTQWVTGWTYGSVTYTFDLPDGTVINKVYHEWKGQGNQSATVNYAYDEGTPTSISKSHQVGPAGDLVLQWTAADSSTHNVNFETLFTGPITVAGGDGFTVTVSNGLICLGAMVLDVSTSGGDSPYENWAGGAPFDGDKNGDGVRNGLAFLLGSANPDASALGLLPAPTGQNSGDLVLSFSMRNAAHRGASVLKVQWSTDLGVSDLWSANEVVVPETSGTVNGVMFVITPGDPLNGVVATIPSGEAGGGGKLFGRLEGTE